MVFHEALLSAGYIVSLLINAIVAFIAIMIVEKIIAHNIEAKKSFVMAIVALFIVPIIGIYAVQFVSIPYFGAFILPLIVWIALGEVLLESDTVTKLKVAVVAFVAYIVLSIYLTPLVLGLVP